MIYNMVVVPVKESLHEAVQRAILRSIRVIEYEGLEFAHLHAWSLLGQGEEYRRLLEMQDEVDGLLLDFRDGFGGMTIPAMRFLFGADDGRDGWFKPTVVLIADGTRSAKEIVVDAAKRQHRALLVGTPTPGHVTSVGGLQRIGSNGLLMVPGYRFELEGHPTEPDYAVERDIRYCAGTDPQLKRALQILANLVCE
jgi:C-terminal processing protease CtpA/Prc